ncbi:hypothetical protein J6590_044131 [Homalodisca vitripennis]|nr:hypothetical protein J6590_044131 [Homalodisca vitripennis]
MPSVPEESCKLVSKVRHVKRTNTLLVEIAGLGYSLAGHQDKIQCHVTCMPLCPLKKVVSSSVR